MRNDPLARAAAHAAAYRASLATRHVAATATPAELRARLGRPLTDDGVPADRVIDELVGDVEAGLLATSGPRFFGWVMGGTHDVALAADWLVSAWDQNPAIAACAPAQAAIEEIAGAWLLDLLGLPASASFGFVTGSQAAHVVALAAARHRLLAAAGHDVRRVGLYGAPPLRILVGPERHATIDRAATLLGLGRDAVETVGADREGRIDPAALRAALDGRAAIVCLAAGDLNAGAFDDIGACVEAARSGPAPTWVHVDGAFGLWAAASPRLRSLVAGLAAADSWATDLHKVLNVPFDAGFVAVAHPEDHRAALTADASYMVTAGDLRDALPYNPEWSRRSRAVPAYATLRTLGRSGVAALVERLCDLADRLLDGLGALPTATVRARGFNQGIVRFGDDAATERVIAAVQADGTAWFGPATWHGDRVMRVSVTSHATTPADIDATIVAVGRALR